jgi:hypothetical protein
MVNRVIVLICNPAPLLYNALPYGFLLLFTQPQVLGVIIGVPSADPKHAAPTSSIAPDINYKRTSPPYGIPSAP